MSVPLNRLLEHVIEGEPEVGEEVDAVFRAADRLRRRRRTRVLLTAGAIAIAMLAAAGYLLTSTLMPSMDEAPPVGSVSPSDVPVPSDVADPVLALIAPVVGDKLHIYPRPPERGNGWRQYSLVGADGKPRGTLELAVYTVRDDLCFPVLAAPNECAKTQWAPAGVEYVRYDAAPDPDWQVHETMARRISDGRTVAVMATGERGADSASHGTPGLTGAQVEKVATDKRLFDAFVAGERCFGPSVAACPAFKVAVPVDQTS